jgi:hypothetical protein
MKKLKIKIGSKAPKIKVGSKAPKIKVGGKIKTKPKTSAKRYKRPARSTVGKRYFV